MKACVDCGADTESKQSPRCPACRAEHEREKMRAWRAANRDNVREHDRKWKAERPDIGARKYARNYSRRKTPTKHGNMRASAAQSTEKRKWARKQRAENPCKVRDLQRKWRESNLEKARHRRAR